LSPTRLDDFALDAMDAQERRDAYEALLERDRAGSLIVASNRKPDEWLATFADPVRAQSALDRFTGRALTSSSRASPTVPRSSSACRPPRGRARPPTDDPGHYRDTAETVPQGDTQIWPDRSIAL
jgi:hypothetical protein